MASGGMIETIDIDIRRKVYDGGLCAIRDLSFSARGGEFIAIVGPSGAGKTTLLKILCGLDRAVDGRVAINGDSAIWTHRPRIGYVFQESRLMPWLSVRRNIELVTAHRPGLATGVDEILEQVGMAGFADAWPGQLSGGMQRRVALARAFVVEPELLLLDEAFQSLDDPTANGLRNLLLALWRQYHPLVFFVTHRLREALAMADRVLFVSSRPASLILDYPVPLGRPREVEGAEVNTLHTELLTRHPELLSGLTKGGDVGDGGDLPDNATPVSR
jgi:NitT/TauT family transport system ATP-binding protein